MSSEENSVVPECFKQFEKFPGAIFLDGKILFAHYSTFLLVLQTLVGIALYLGILYLMYISGLMRNGFLTLVMLSFCLIFFIICSVNINIYTAIDYKDNELYKELNIFGKTLFTFGYVEIRDILQVSNNVIPQLINPEGKNNRVKPNPKTNLFHKYVVSFLVHNGDLIDFLELGGYEEYYEISKNLAKAISEHWGIPLVVCSDNQRLYVAGVEERYHLAQEGIPFSHSRDVFIAVIVVITLALFGISFVH